MGGPECPRTSARQPHIRLGVGATSAEGCRVDLGALATRRDTAHRVHSGVMKGLLVPHLRWGVYLRVPHDNTQRGARTHIKVIVEPYLDGELFANPRLHLKPFRAIEAAAVADLAHSRFAFALLGEDPTGIGVVSRTPEDKCEQARGQRMNKTT